MGGRKALNITEFDKFVETLALEYKSIEVLHAQSTMYRRTKCMALKDAYNKYKKFTNLRKRFYPNCNNEEVLLRLRGGNKEESSEDTIDMNSSSFEDSDSSFVLSEESSMTSSTQEHCPIPQDNSSQAQNEEEEERVYFVDRCENCHRRQSEESTYDPIEFEVHSTSAIKRRQKFRHVEASQVNERNVNLCSVCANFLVHENDSKEANKLINTWPSFVWTVLSNNRVQTVYGSKVWSFVPKEWRCWWIDEVKIYFPGIYEDITSNNPIDIFVDKTMQLKEWNEDIESRFLSRLEKSCNKNLLPTTLCPWGCSEYLHKCGYIQLDIAWQRFLPKCLIVMTNNHSSVDLIASARDDFVRDEFDCWLLNKKWSVKPSIRFVPGIGPCILTCRDHHGGTKKLMVHIPRMIHNLPAGFPDQLCHAVSYCRTVRPMKACTYSNTYQMHEQRGNFNGLDTCNITMFRKFNFFSVLLKEREDSSIVNRVDINALLDQLVLDREIPEELARNMREEAKKKAEEIDYNVLVEGATFVPLEAAMVIQSEKNEKEDRLVIFDKTINDQGGGGDNEHQVKFIRRNWPLVLFPLQNCNTYGAKFPTIPLCNGSNTSMLWLLTALLTQVEEIWKIVEKTELRESQWHGWMLTWVSSKCLPNFSRRVSPQSPFKMNKMRTYGDIVNKVSDACGDDNRLSDVFIQNAGKILCIDTLEDLFDDDGEGFAFDTIEVVIIENHRQCSSRHDALPFHDTLTTETEQNDDSYPEFEFELRCIIQLDDRMIPNKWDGIVYSRHGGHFSSWWSQSTKQKAAFCIQMHESPSTLIEHVRTVAVYVKKKDANTKSLRDEFLRYIGGQDHIFCHHHNLPLITSANQDRKCSICEKKEYMMCPHIDCDVCICKICSKVFDPNVKSTVRRRQDSNESDESHEREGQANEEDDHSDDNNDSLIEPYDMDEEDINNITVNIDNEDGDDDNSHGTSGEEEHIFENDDLDDFIATSDDPDLAAFDIDDDEGAELIPTTNAGEVAHEVMEEDETRRKKRNEPCISGSVFINHCGTALTRKKYELKANSKQNYVLQKISATTPGKSIPLMYVEAVSFPGEFYHSLDGVSVTGALPACLLSDDISRYGFQSIPQHARARISNPSSTSSSNPHYIAHLFDVMSNLAANHSDTRIILNRGLLAGQDDDKDGGLGLRGKNDSNIHESIDSKQMVRNLCAAQKYIKSDFFVTYTCNQKKHFGTKPIKEWIDSEDWNEEYEGFHELSAHQQEEIRKSITQAAGALLFRTWEEASKLFLEYLHKSPSSPFINILAYLFRKEYQPEKGNLSHVHGMIAISWKDLNQVEKDFIDTLIRASYLDVVLPNEVPKLIDHGIVDNVYDVSDVYCLARQILTHHCSPRCQVMVQPGKTICRKIDYLKKSKDNTTDTFIDLPNDLSYEAIDHLIKIGLIYHYEMDEKNKEIKNWKSSHPFFHPKRHIPPTNPTDYVNMSPVEGYTFAVCQSMQNIQLLTQCGGVNKYVVKYIGKVDEQNYVVVSADGRKKDGSLVTKKHFLHNTKLTSSKINEDKLREKRRDRSHIQGKIISQNEMLHHIFKYPEVVTDFVFEQVSTKPLELRAGVETTSKLCSKEGDDITLVNEIREQKNLPLWRRHSESETMLISEIKGSKISVDKINQFSLRPPEFRHIIDKVEHYYRWFYIEHGTLSEETMTKEIDSDIFFMSSWIDGLHRRIRVRKKAIPEICQYLYDNEDEIEVNEGTQAMKTVISMIAEAFTLVAPGCVPIEVDDVDEDFVHHVRAKLVHDDDDERHLPIPVFCFVRPTMGYQFILHLLLSMGRFTNEIDMMMHSTIRESLRWAKLIGPNDDEESLQQYSNVLLRRYIEEQLVNYPNPRRVIDSWIVAAADLLDDVIVKNSLPIANMPPVQQTALFASVEDNCIKYKESLKNDVISAALNELESSTERCAIPSLQTLKDASKENPLEWDAFASYRHGESQPTGSYLEQKFAIKVIKRTIDLYMEGGRFFTKCIGIRGYAGTGKSWTLQYMLVYAASKGLFVMTSSMMARRSNFLGGKHLHHLFCLPTESNLSPHRMAELSITKILRKPEKLNLIRTIDILFHDEIGQMSAEMLSVLDIILRKLRDNNIFLGGMLVICTLDHTQLQPIKGMPFLLSSHILSCFKMVMLKTSVRASGDPDFQRLQEIARMNYKCYGNQPELIDEFRLVLARTCTFVQDWNDPQITKNTIRLSGKKQPVIQMAQEYVEQTRNSMDPDNLRVSEAHDIEKPRFSHIEWTQASENTSTVLTRKVKEPKTLLLFKGGIYEFTFNSEGNFSQAQMGILFDLPSPDDVEQGKKINILVAPSGLSDFEFNESNTKEYCLQRGFKEKKVGMAPERPISLNKGNTQAIRKQYGLKHRITATLHATMGDTLQKAAISISKNDTSFRLWDKAQVIVALSRTKLGKNLIFVGNQNETIEALSELIQTRNQWTDYMEDVLKIITITENDNDVLEQDEQRMTLHQTNFPFRICDISLPQCRTGYVYYLSSLKDRSHVFIGSTKCIRTTIQVQNSGYGNPQSEPVHLRPFVILGYICGFDDNQQLQESVKEQWIEMQRRLKISGENDPMKWVACGHDVIRDVESSYVEMENELRFVKLFCEDHERRRRANNEHNRDDRNDENNNEEWYDDDL